jgi:hypothetical protein
MPQPQPPCRTCGKAYSEESMTAYQAAPGWDNDCSECTRRRFEAYVKDYLLQNFTVNEIAPRVAGYFGLRQNSVPSVDDREPIIEFITASVLDQRLGPGGKTSPTPGDAIAEFVEYFDERVTKIEKALSSRARRTVSRTCIAGIVLVLVAWLMAWLLT